MNTSQDLLCNGHPIYGRVCLGTECRETICEGLRCLDPKSVPNVPCGMQIVPARIVNIYDGDTLTVVLPFASTFFIARIRVDGIDAPEKSLRKGVTPLEKKAGIAVADYVKSIISVDDIVDVVLYKVGMYGGRYIGDVFIDGQTLSSHLLEMGMVKPYQGKTKEPWTVDELNSIISICQAHTPKK